MIEKIKLFLVNLFKIRDMEIRDEPYLWGYEKWTKEDERRRKALIMQKRMAMLVWTGAILIAGYVIDLLACLGAIDFEKAGRMLLGNRWDVPSYYHFDPLLWAVLVCVATYFFYGANLLFLETRGEKKFIFFSSGFCLLVAYWAFSWIGFLVCLAGIFILLLWYAWICISTERALQKTDLF